MNDRRYTLKWAGYTANDGQSVRAGIGAMIQVSSKYDFKFTMQWINAANVDGLTAM